MIIKKKYKPGVKSNCLIKGIPDFQVPFYNFTRTKLSRLASILYLGITYINIDKLRKSCMKNYVRNLKDISVVYVYACIVMHCVSTSRRFYRNQLN